MPTANTGYKRSLTIIIKKFVNGVIQLGYPKTYDGQAAFDVDGQSFLLITDAEFALLSAADFNTRLGYFKLYVAQQEGLASIEPYFIPGSNPRVYDPASCPIIDNPL